MSNSKETIGKTFLVAGILCVVCSAVISVSVVSLREKQEYNMLVDKRSNILSAGGIDTSNIDVNAVYESSIEVRYITLPSGDYLEETPSESFDSVTAAKSKEFGEKIPAKKDLADIKVRSKISEVYILKGQNDEVSKIILPVRGKGLWSTMLGFAAVDNSGKTMAGLTFYSHGETAGLGGEIDNPTWKAIWPGKKIYDDEGNVELQVIKGNVIAGNPKEDYQVDGLAGATLTARGVSNLVAYWFGPEGYKNYLSKLGGN